MANVPPYSTGIFDTIVGVHFGKPLYVVVRVFGANQSNSFGPYPPAPTIAVPSFRASESKSAGVKLLDTKPIPGANNSTNSFTSCFVYFDLLGPIRSWVLFWDVFGRFNPVDQSCPTAEGEAPAIPINYESSVEVATDFLFLVPTAGKGVITIDVSNIMAFFDSGFNTADASQRTINGNATLLVYVYSTVKNKVTKLSQLIDYNFVGDRPTEDDHCSLDITSANQGRFLVDLHKDKDEGHAQIDNYGKSFQPYKVTLDPNSGTDHVPSQPPPRLG